MIVLNSSFCQFIEYQDAHANLLTESTDFILNQGWAVETTPSFNRLKLPWSICQKVVNTGQYKSEWSIEIFERPFWWWIEILGQVYILFIEKRNKYCFIPAKGTFYLSTDFCIYSSGT